jgi:hypothetical protein
MVVVVLPTPPFCSATATISHCAPAETVIVEI